MTAASRPTRRTRRPAIDPAPDGDQAGPRRLRLIQYDVQAADGPSEAEAALPDPGDRARSERHHRLAAVAVVLVVAVAAAAFLAGRGDDADPSDRAGHDPPPSRPDSTAATESTPSSVPDTSPAPTSGPTVPAEAEAEGTTPSTAAPQELDESVPPPTAAMPPGDPPSVSHLLVTATGARITWEFAFDDRGAGLADCTVLANGIAVWAGTCESPVMSGAFVGGYDTLYDISVRATSPNGSDSTAPATLHTTTPAVSITRGTPVQNDRCWVVSCRYIAVTLGGFTPSVAVTVTCVDGADGQGPFKTLTFQTTAEGTGTLSPCFFGFPGRPVWVEVEGFKSNLITW